MKYKYSMKKGSILITVLIIITICTTVALFIHERAVSSYGTVIGLQYDYQGAIYAMTAIQALEAAFKYDDKPYDSSESIWNQIPPIPVENGFLNAFIRPLNAKLPLAPLAIDNETVRERYVNGFNKLKDKLELTECDTDRLIQWVGVGNPSTERFDESGSPYNIKSSQLQTLAELAYIPTFKNEYKKLSEYVSIAGDGNKINLNVASEDVITSLVPELEPYVKEIIEKREEEPLKNISDLYQIMGSSMQEVYSKILPYVDVKSSLFYAKLELNIGDEFRYYHVLLQRNGKSVKPIKYIEGGNIEYF